MAEKLSARGFAATALNGDIAQQQRERTIERLKKGKLDILVATDVAARGLDVERISHVVNYDIPHDTEAYIHRIGRTGRAGREGDAILFVAPRERRLLNAIEKATNKKIEMMELPSTELINDKRIQQFKQTISDTLAIEDLGLFTHLVEQYQQEHNIPALEIASALARMVQGDTPLLLQHKPTPKRDRSWDKDNRDENSGRSRVRQGRREGGSDSRSGKSNARGRPSREARNNTDRDRQDKPDEGMERFRIAVGHNHKVLPGNIVGAIANEAGIDAKHIGRINIFDDHSIVDLPGDMPEDIFRELKKVWVSGETLKISRESGEEPYIKKSRPALNKGNEKRRPKGKVKKKSKDTPRSKPKLKVRATKKDKGKPSKKNKSDTK